MFRNLTELDRLLNQHIPAMKIVTALKLTVLSIANKELVDNYIGPLPLMSILSGDQSFDRKFILQIRGGLLINGKWSRNNNNLNYRVCERNKLINLYFVVFVLIQSHLYIGILYIYRNLLLYYQYKTFLSDLQIAAAIRRSLLSVLQVVLLQWCNFIINCMYFHSKIFHFLSIAV